MAHIPNETLASCARTTRDGRTLTYEMSVLQQPQRARACGSGAKSSADRRPVDPPPVVELKVFEGENRKDITFQHNANFFLFTTLESARQIAPARGAPPPQPHPVLTGMPVAGMAYLDRPTQAGYFIFPDLSVRHEGKFRLSFNLYEELKEAKDMDPEGAGQALPPPQHRNGEFMPGMAHVHFRLEVKSQPFTVFSAKKFPGLAESTQLSRLVAEQGCRVRIRRDVRMRRRETKPSKDFDAYSDDGEVPTSAQYTRDRFATPDNYAHGDTRAPSVADSYTLERRSSSQDLSGYYQQQQQPPPQQQAPVPQQAPPVPAPSAHLQFSNGTATAPQYAQQQPAQPASYAQPYAYQQQAPPPSSHVRQQSSTSSIAYAQTSYPTASRPASQTYRGYEYPAVDTRFTSAYDSARPPTPGGSSQAPQLPPLKDITSVQQHGQPSTPLSASSPSYDSYGPPQVATPAPAGGKRAYGKTFDDSHVGGSITQGSRPQAVGADVIQVECDDGTLVDQDELISLRMLSYRRADGSRQSKRIPATY